MNKTEKAYKEILKTLNKYKNDIIFDVSDLETKAKNHLFGVELVEKYGFNLNPKVIDNTRWQRLKENIFIGFLDGKNRKIAWSDDNRQPNNETLLCIEFPTGAYIFGDDYPQHIFNEFFSELKTYEPKYTDSANKCLYFTLDKAGKIFNDYDSILKKYYDKNREDLKQRKIDKLKDELSKLETE